MAHHSPQPFDDSLIRRFASDLPTEKLGATGKFPEGKLTDTDEGEIQFRIAAVDGKVVVDFGTPTSWVGMLPEQAEELAASLNQKATEARA